MTANQQMELSINNGRTCASHRRPQERQSRARWWFNRMREVVDQATDWRPTPPARPQQMRFSE